MSPPIIGITGYADESRRSPDVRLFLLSAPYVPALTPYGECVGVQWHRKVTVDRHPRRRGLFEAVSEAAQA